MGAIGTILKIIGVITLLGLLFLGALVFLTKSTIITKVTGGSPAITCEQECTCVKIEKVPEDSRSKYASVIATLVEERYSVNTDECNISLLVTIEADGCNKSLETIETAKTIVAEFDCPGSPIIVEYDPESNTLIGGGIIPSEVTKIGGT